MPSDLWKDIGLPEVAAQAHLREALLRHTLAQLNKDLELSGSRKRFKASEEPAQLISELARWMPSAPPDEVIRFLYRLDIPESFVAEGPAELARRCFQRALMKVWLRHARPHGSKGENRADFDSGEAS